MKNHCHHSYYFFFLIFHFFCVANSSCNIPIPVSKSNSFFCERYGLWHFHTNRSLSTLHIKPLLPHWIQFPPTKLCSVVTGESWIILWTPLQSSHFSSSEPLRCTKPSRARQDIRFQVFEFQNPLTGLSSLF